MEFFYDYLESGNVLNLNPAPDLWSGWMMQKNLKSRKVIILYNRFYLFSCIKKLLPWKRKAKEEKSKMLFCVFPSPLVPEIF